MTEELERLQMMADPKQTKWDLSPNDQAAIRFVLKAWDEGKQRCDALTAQVQMLEHHHREQVRIWGELSETRESRDALEELERMRR
jgi:hypothetical protein